MKNNRNVLSCLIILLVGLFYTAAYAQQKKASSDVVYELDIKKSKLFWKAPKNRHYGFILFNSGSLSNLVAGWPSQGTFSINMNSMSSRDGATASARKKVDDELRTESFFNVSKYPAATMLIKQILAVQTPDTFKILGELNIKGISNPINFIATMKQYGNGITAKANVTISREKWNINHQPDASSWNLLARVKDNLVDDEIAVNLELVFIRKNIIN